MGAGASKILMGIVMNDVRKLLVGVIAGVIGFAGGAWGQTHKVAKPENVVRAVGVYEWTGGPGQAWGEPADSGDGVY